MPEVSTPIELRTPLTDPLYAITLTGEEGLSRLFFFEVDVLAEHPETVAFDRLLGQDVSVTVPVAGGDQRHFSGICSRVSLGVQRDRFTALRLGIVPKLWLLTRRTQSRIFQHVSVPDILKKVLDGIDFTFEIQGSFQPRDFCVQYRESDFDFASRLMEEEGIYYFFKHDEKKSTMVLANTPTSHPDMPEPSSIVYGGVPDGARDEGRIDSWEKTQELRSGKVTLWDHTFELPHKHLEADKTILESVAVGEVTHKLKVGNNDKLELYDWPGGYAQRFDGIDRGGGEQAGDLQKIFQDNARTVGIRMQEEAVGSVVIQGTSSCVQLTSGYKFKLEQHYNGDGSYVVTSVQHTFRVEDQRKEEEPPSRVYSNIFTCIPAALPFRPPRVTPRPVVRGSQTAVVVGPAGEDIFTDKYGRVKVQFHWDREGKNDANSACWLRVATLWAGKQWGVIHIPRIGQEVLVDFLEGDPDQPIIVGSVYNADQMPPYALPANKTQSGVKSRSSLGGSPDNFNEIRFEDKKGSEELYIHAEKNENIVVENDKTETVGHDETITIDNDRSETVVNNETLSVGSNRSRSVGGNEAVTIGVTRTHTVGVNEAITIGAAQEVTVGAAQTITVGAVQATTVGAKQEISVGADQNVSVGANQTEEVAKKKTLTVGDEMTHSVGKTYKISVGKKLQVDAEEEITIKTGDAEIIMKKDGDITINGKKITIKGSGDVVVKGSKILEN